ncbi:hypothetical protein TKK_0018225 [Trichogramma kaykai]|uniref:Uncharacterized protein n=1 Tax=Trichogramma kaykai TaxID=54128 RepID=A0ABD2VZ90_9HYME
MFTPKQPYFYRTNKQFSLLKLVDLYDKDSFIREYLLDNVFVCIFMYILFYFAICYAHKVIKQIEDKNEEMIAKVNLNRTKVNDMIAIKNHRMEYEEVVMNTKKAQKVTTKHLDSEIKRLSTKLMKTQGKLNELENFVAKWKYWKSCTERTKKMSNCNGEYHQDEIDPEIEINDVKILDPSFPPSNPPEPPPRKFGVFARPPTMSGGSKIGFK